MPEIPRMEVSVALVSSAARSRASEAVSLVLDTERDTVAMLGSADTWPWPTTNSVPLLSARLIDSPMRVRDANRTMPAPRVTDIIGFDSQISRHVLLLGQKGLPAF